MDREYEKVKEDYLKISSETRNKLTALSVILIGAIYFFAEKGKSLVVDIDSLKIALFFYIFTIMCEVLAGLFKSQHYSLWFDDKIKTLDFRESVWGRLAEFLFWIPVITFMIGSFYFFNGLFEICI